MTNQKIIDFQKEKQKKKEKIELTSQNLYDINKNLVKQTSHDLKQDELDKKIDNIIIPFFKKNIHKKLDIEDRENAYFMLLCREANDYTIFNFRLYLDYSEPLNYAASTLIECLNNRGKIYSIEETQDKVALEIWIDHLNYGVTCYYLFPYDEGVIEI